MKRTREEIREAIPKLSSQSKDYLLTQMLGVARVAEKYEAVYGEIIIEAFNEIIDEEEAKK